MEKCLCGIRARRELRERDETRTPPRTPSTRFRREGPNTGDTSDSQPLTAGHPRAGPLNYDDSVPRLSKPLGQFALDCSCLLWLECPVPLYHSIFVSVLSPWPNETSILRRTFCLSLSRLGHLYILGRIDCCHGRLSKPFLLFPLLAVVSLAFPIPVSAAS